jgi:Beta-1,3-glucanase
MRTTILCVSGAVTALMLLGACSGGGEATGGTGDGTSASSGEAASTSATSTGGGPTSSASSSGAGGGSQADPKQEPAGFWDTRNLPKATNVMTFKFLNRTNGKYKDSEVFWSFKQGGIQEVHSIAEKPTYDMPVSASGRMYFYLGAPDSKYYDFIEHTISATQYNGNTTRVDAFGLKIAMRLHCADGFEATVGEDYGTFLEDRAVTFKKFMDEVPAEFQHLAQIQAPYRIVEPGAGQFKKGGMYEHYYDATADKMWANNGLTFPKPGPNGAGLAAYPDVSAALMRNVGTKAGTFSSDGKLMDKNLWADDKTFYATGPADYYAKFWHTHGLSGKAYGFPYDDVGGYSSYVSHKTPEYMLVAIGY